MTVSVGNGVGLSTERLTTKRQSVTVRRVCKRITQQRKATVNKHKTVQNVQGGACQTLLP